MISAAKNIRKKNLKGLLYLTACLCGLCLFQESKAGETETRAIDISDSLSAMIMGGELQNTVAQAQPSWGFNEVITAEQLMLFGDQNLSQSLKRFTGVQSARDGSFSVRGVRGASRGLYNVAIDGQHLSATGAGSRITDLGGISLRAVNEVELVRVLTPDMQADALGGLIAVRTDRAATAHPAISASMAGGLHGSYDEKLSPDARISAAFSQRFGERISFSADAYLDRTSEAIEYLGITYDLADIGELQSQIAATGVSPELETNQRSSLGGRFQLRYHPSETQKWFIAGFAGTNAMQQNAHTVQKSVTGPVSLQEDGRSLLAPGAYGYNIATRDQDLTMVATSGGFSQRFQAFDLHARAGWSHSTRKDDGIEIPFLRNGETFEISMDNLANPEMAATNGAVALRDMRIEPMQQLIQEHRDNTFSGNVDVDLPVGPVQFKLGTGVSNSTRKGDYRNSELRVAGLMDLSRFQLEDWEAYNVGGQSHNQIPVFANAQQSRAFFERNYASFRKDNRGQRRNSDIWNYNSTENIFSGYVMASGDAGLLRWMTGVRVEHTSARYEGYDVLFDDIGNHAGTVDTSKTSTYSNFFPHAQLSVALTEKGAIGLALSRSMARADYLELTPFRLLDIQGQTVFRGNATLKPMTSNNVDLQFNYRFGETGFAVIGLFYKNIQNMVVERTRLIEDGEFENYTERTFENGERSAHVYGLEITWRQNLRFLPGPLGNFALYGNYTLSDSRFEIDERTDTPRLPGQSPHIVNVGLNYQQNRFSGQVSYHWTAPSILRLEGSDSPFSAITGMTYPDMYEDGFRDVNFSVRFHLTGQFVLFGDAGNLFPAERVTYTESRNRFAHQAHLRGSRTVQLGLRFDL